MSKPSDYTYSAATFGNGGWIVKRFDEHNLCQEARVDGAADEKEAINKAIAAGTWA